MITEHFLSIFVLYFSQRNILHKTYLNLIEYFDNDKRSEEIQKNPLANRFEAQLECLKRNVTNEEKNTTVL